MLLSSVLFALVLTIYFGAWAVSENVDARSLRSINETGLVQDESSIAIADAKTTRVENTFLFLCPLH
ncbi:MAG: hypothetical protein QF554_14320 [Dehalococcoidia bacterium]|jgi:hypothetical protein|nr:hypothetical protein [Dehalococcoidia bacterium]